MFRNYASFGGRAPRAEYWYFVLFTVVAGAIIGVLEAAWMPPLATLGDQLAAGTGVAIFPLGTAFNILVFIPTLAVLVRRLHDTGRSGKRLLLPLLFTLLAMLGALMAFAGAVEQGSKFQGDGTRLSMIGGGLMVLGGLGLMGFGIAFFVWLCRRGTPGPNRYGPDPLAR